MLKGRLGLDSAQVPYIDRSGCLYLARGALTSKDGTLSFEQGNSSSNDALAKGSYLIPVQRLSMILMGPGSTVSHDALRLLAFYRTALVAVGEDGVRQYTIPPLTSNQSVLARQQAKLWADKNLRLSIARRMYDWRFGKKMPQRCTINVLRGIEGSRMKESYALWATRLNIEWNGRRYNRADPEGADLPNQGLNHAATATEAAAAIAVSATATIPQLGFIHEDPGHSFVLDIADLFRDSVTIPCAFMAAKEVLEGKQHSIERSTRRLVGQKLAKDKIIPAMIDRIKQLLENN